MCSETYKINEQFSIRVVRNLDEFKKLKDTWDCLAEKCASYTPWLSHDWFDLWLKFFFREEQLFILQVYEKHRLTAIAPFLIRHKMFKGVLRTKAIELIGNVHSPIRHFLLGDSDDKQKAAILSSILYFLSNTYKEWDIVELDKLPEEQSVFNIVEHAIVTAGLQHRSCFCTGNWYLDKITYPSTGYFEKQPYGFRKQIENKKKRLRKVGSWRVEIKSDIKPLDKDLYLYDQLRAKSWKSPEKDSEFNKEFTKLAADKGWLRLSILFSGDVPIAYQKWLVCHKKAYIWDLIYDFDYKKYSPGSILSSEICKHVIDNDRVVEIDYLTGDESYKKNWTPQRRERKSITMFNHNLKGQFLGFLMTTVLTFIEKHPPLLFAKNKLSNNMKK